jgi:hypothetical protein
MNLDSAGLLDSIIIAAGISRTSSRSVRISIIAAGVFLPLAFC